MTNKKTELLTDLAMRDGSLLLEEMDLCVKNKTLVDLTNSIISIPLIEEKYFSNIDFSGSVFTNGIWENVSVAMCVFKGCEYTNLKLRKIEFAECDLSRTLLTSVSIEDTCFFKSNLSKITLHSGVVKRGVFIGCSLSDARLNDCYSRYNLFKKCELDRLCFNPTVDLDTNIFYKCTNTPMTLSIEETLFTLKQLKKKLYYKPTIPESDEQPPNEEDFVSEKLSIWAEMPDYED